MARLPKPGSDENIWGDVLNDFLNVEHNQDGTLKIASTVASKVSIGGDLGGTPSNPLVNSLHLAAPLSIGQGGTGAATQVFPIMRGDWATQTAYALNDIVQLQSGSFLSLSAHTSSTSGSGQVAAFQTDLLAGKWKPMSPRRQWYDVRDYGAKLDNGNDTVAIQSAIDACAAAGGGTVFIPAATVGVTQLVIKNHVWLRGAGRWATTIRCLSSTNGVVIKNFVSPDGVVANAEFFAILDLKIDGNKAANTGTGSHGISITTNPLFTKATNDDWFDLHYLIQNLMIINCAGTGIRTSGRSEGRIQNVYVEKCDNGGIDPSFDTYLQSCSTGDCTGFGFSFTHGNIMAVQCKAFITGRSSGVDAPGFYVSGLGTGITLSSCIAQNNTGQGFLLKDATGAILSGCVADSNNYGTSNAVDDYAGLELNNASNCIIDLVSTQGFQAGVQVGNQGSALRVTNGSDKNDVRTVTYGQPGYTLGSSYTADSVLLQNKIVVDGQQLNPIDVFAGGLLGDGSDGAAILNGTNIVAWATLAGSIYSLTRDAYTTSLTIQSGITLVCSGFRIFSQGSVTNSGTLAANGADATTATGAAAATSRSLGAGAKGGNGTTTAGTVGTTGGFGVGNGGAGGNGSPGAGGAGANAITNQNWVLKNGHYLAIGAIGYASAVSVISGGAGGSGGGGDGTNAGGGGGAGGSLIAMLCKSFVNAVGGVLSAHGGNGFSPASGNCGGGGGGGGGGIFIFAITLPTNNGTTNVSGGTGGAGSGTGTVGATGTSGTVLLKQLQ
jgi:parallel beta-helix repeat protein